MIPAERSTRAVTPPPVNQPGSYPLDQVRLSRLMDITSGSSDVVVGLIDGPVAVDHPDYAKHSSRALPGMPAACAVRNASCVHGTFVAGILAARRGTASPAICPGCTFLLRPIFGEDRLGSRDLPSATPGELATAMLECIEHGAQILNVSAALTATRAQERGELAQVLDLAARRGVLVVAAAGNQGVIAGSTLTRHHWVVPVVAYSRLGRPMEGATLGSSIGRRGLGAPGEGITSLAPGGGSVQLGGSSAAAPFVTGAAALISSKLPGVSGTELRFALVTSAGSQRRGVVPPLLDAWTAYRNLAKARGR